MTWPGVSDYQEAIQAPQLCFGDAELKSGSPVLTPLGLPRPISGGNASVYQIRSGKNEFAVRCFLRDVPDLRQRYAAIDQHLRASRLQSKVGFTYLQDGIRIRGKWYPVLKMAWVRGVPLNDYIEKNVKEPKVLGRLADAWATLMRELAREKIAHGDLQHGNVLVANDKLLLIDYDGMYVPSLHGKPSHEIGHASYQHPQREDKDFGPQMDRFSALAIHVAIRALIQAPQLWEQYTNSDNVLFTQADFNDPRSSALFGQLEQLGDADFKATVQALRAACSAPVDQVPDLDGAVKAGKNAARTAAPVAPPARAAAAPAPAPMPAPAAATIPAQGAPIPGSRRSRKKHKKSRPAAANATPGQANARANKPQWLADLVGKAPANAGANASAAGPAGATFALAQSWQRNAQSLATRSAVSRAAARAQQQRLQRAVVWTLLFLLVQLVAWAVYRPLLALTLGGFLSIGLWRRARAKRAAAAPAAAAGTTRAAAAATALAFSVDDRWLAVAGNDGYASVIDAGTGNFARRLGPHGQPVIAVVAAGKDRFATATREGAIRLFDEAGNLARSWHDGRCHSAAASADGQLLAFGASGRLVKLWSNDGRDCGTLRGHKQKVLALAFAKDKQRLVSGSADQTVRIWSVASRCCEHVLQGHRDAVVAVAISADGRCIASAGRDGRLCLWDATRARLLHEIEVPSLGLRAVAITADGGTVMAAGTDRTIHCVDVASGRFTGTVPGHAHTVTAIGIAHDGRTIASADAGGTVTVWQRRAPAAAPAAPAPRQPQLAHP